MRSIFIPLTLPAESALERLPSDTHSHQLAAVRVAVAFGSFVVGCLVMALVGRRRAAKLVLSFALVSIALAATDMVQAADGSLQTQNPWRNRALRSAPATEASFVPISATHFWRPHHLSTTEHHHIVESWSCQAVSSQTPMRAALCKLPSAADCRRLSVGFHALAHTVAKVKRTRIRNAAVAGD